MDRLHENLIVRALGRIELVVSFEMRDATRKAGMVGEILVHEAVVIGLRGTQVVHERHHRIGIVARARHQQQPVLVGLQFIRALLFGDDALFGNLSEAIDDR